MRNCHLKTTALHSIICLVSAAVLGSACTEKNHDYIRPGNEEDTEKPVEPGERPPFEEVVPEIITFTQSNLVYRGDTGDAKSDCWELTLLTENASIDDLGFPVGPGHVLNLKFNAAYNDAQNAEVALSNIVGRYISPETYSDMSVGKYHLGFEDVIVVPGASMVMPYGSFYAEMPENMESKDYAYDYLKEGVFTISRNADGKFTVAGQLSGESYLKRHFTFTGQLEPIDRAEAEITIPNSTLTKDIDLTQVLCQGLLQDLGNRFWLPDPTHEDVENDKPHSKSYSTVQLDIADENVEMVYWPRLIDKTSGEVLKITFFVPYGTDIAKDGIPAGEYRLVPHEGRDEYGIDREYIRPGYIVPGEKDDFSLREGTWYMPLRKSDVGQDILGHVYARIDNGVMTVTRTGEDGAGHSISFEFLDDAGHKVSGTWSTDKAIPIRQTISSK